MPYISVKNFTPCSARKFWIVKWRFTNHWLEGFVFPQCDEFRLPFFIRNPSFNGSCSRCSWGLRGTRCSPSACRNLSTRGFSHGWSKGEGSFCEFLRKWENEKMRKWENFECWWREKSVLVTKMAHIYREESPTVIYTRFDANLAVTTASF